MAAALHFDPIRLPPECVALRKEVRAFPSPRKSPPARSIRTSPTREDTDAPEFSRRVGQRGWLGMTWPRMAATNAPSSNATW